MSEVGAETEAVAGLARNATLVRGICAPVTVTGLPPLSVIEYRLIPFNRVLVDWVLVDAGRIYGPTPVVPAQEVGVEQPENNEALVVHC